MNQHQFIRREYRAIIQSVKELSTASAVTLPAQKLLKTLKMGWLTPGSDVLNRLENKKISPQAVLRKPALLQKKWFQELPADKKTRWIGVFWDLTAKLELSNILGLSDPTFCKLTHGSDRRAPGR